MDTATTVLDLVGVFLNALLGGTVARRDRLDLFGFLVIGIASGLGGGLIRDVLLQHGPPAALTDPAYIPTALAGTGVAFLLDISPPDWSRAFKFLDAAALSVWASVGAQKTMGVGLGRLPAILLGTITAVGGGAIRDLLLQRVPAVLQDTRWYASVAVLVAAVEVLGIATGFPVAGTVAAITLGVLLRIVAEWRGWTVPRGLEVRPSAVLRRRRRRDGDP
ncbi:trimeric intracellular cation channel family protein [Nonomuraea harbinensis]|uniref:Trimeric intracellular cation channel family protein n=1 Tax=Nonomuraea harbinensis TaxID=1286938 RepID=A0ABW1C1I4_9ACTN|nr:TRIC cation channel family protein [Nonomuraea harbinensis]